MAPFRPWAGFPDNLTEDETRVVRDARQGHATVFGPLEHAEDIGTRRTIRAAIIAGLLLDTEQPPAIKELRVQHARIEGPPDLAHALLTAKSADWLLASAVALDLTRLFRK